MAIFLGIFFPILDHSASPLRVIKSSFMAVSISIWTYTIEWPPSWNQEVSTISMSLTWIPCNRLGSIPPGTENGFSAIQPPQFWRDTFSSPAADNSDWQRMKSSYLISKAANGKRRISSLSKMVSRWLPIAPSSFPRKMAAPLFAWGDTSTTPFQSILNIWSSLTLVTDETWCTHIDITIDLLHWNCEFLTCQDSFKEVSLSNYVDVQSFLYFVFICMLFIFCK